MLLAAWLGGTAQADTSLLLSAGTGHPGVRLSVAGAGFSAGEAVDLYVDTVDTTLLSASSTGMFGGTVVIPASAGPGQHAVTAIGRRAGDSAQKTYSVTAPWTELGFGSARAGLNPYENTLTAATVSQLGLLWTSAGPGGGGTPAVGGGRVIVGLAGGVEALSASTGAVLWKKLTTGNFYSSAAVVGNSVYVTEETTGSQSAGSLYALNATTGATLWIRTLASYVRASPVVAGGVIYVGDDGGHFYAIQASNGAILWTYTVTGEQFFNGSAALVGSTVYVGSANGKLYALNAVTGGLLWSYAAGGAITGTPSVVNNVVYFGAFDDKIYAVKTAAPNAGQLLWNVTTGGLIVASPAVASGIVYIGSADGTMYALDAHTGAQRWHFLASASVHSAAVAGGVVYFTTDGGGLYALSASYGGVLATGIVGDSFLGGPAVSDGVLYVDGLGGDTHAFALQAGLDAVRARARGVDVTTLRPDMHLGLTR